MLFVADDAIDDRELWKSDGTKAGTVLVKDIEPDEFAGYPRYLTAVGGTLFFTVDDATRGGERWTSGGTAGGTIMVKEIVRADL